MVDGSGRQRFIIDLPDQEAALALAGQGETTLKKLSDLTGTQLVLRGLQLAIEGRPSQLERAAGLVELLRPFWSEGQAVTPVDIQTSLQALDTIENLGGFHKSAELSVR